MSDREQHVKTLEDALNLALKALEAISDEMTVGERYTNAGQHLLDALQPCRNALQAAPPAPAGVAVPDGFGTAEHWKEKAQYWADVAHRLRGEALRGEPVDGIVHPAQANATQLAGQGHTPERQRMTAGRASFFMERFLKEEKLLGPNEQAALHFVIDMLDAAPAQAQEDSNAS